MIWLVIVLVVAAFVLVMYDARRGPRRSEKTPSPDSGPRRRGNKPS
ncbi:MAG: hypothetical protein ABSD85_10220 [Acidimicrobiales bacterium]